MRGRDPYGPQVTGAGTHAPDASQAVATGFMHAPPQRSQASPHFFPAHGSGGHVKVPTVTHWSWASQAVAANVGTGQWAGSVPGGQ